MKFYQDFSLVMGKDHKHSKEKKRKREREEEEERKQRRHNEKLVGTS